MNKFVRFEELLAIKRSFTFYAESDLKESDNEAYKDYVTSVFPKVLNSKQKLLSRFTGCQLRPIPITNYSINDKKVSLETCIKKAITRIKEKSENKNVYVVLTKDMWSMLLVSCLIENNIKATYLATDNTVRKYKNLKSKLGDNLKIMCEDTLVKYLHSLSRDNNTLFITNELGDILFENYSSSFFSKRELMLPLIEAIEQDLIARHNVRQLASFLVGSHNFFRKECFIDKNFSQLVINELETDLVTFFGSLDITLRQFLWWIYLFYYTEASRRRLVRLGIRTIGNNPNAIHFFDTKEFFDYSYQSHKKLPTKEIQNYIKTVLDENVFQSQWLPACNLYSHFLISGITDDFHYGNIFTFSIRSRKKDLVETICDSGFD